MRLVTPTTGVMNLERNPIPAELAQPGVECYGGARKGKYPETPPEEIHQIRDFPDGTNNQLTGSLVH